MAVRKQDEPAAHAAPIGTWVLLCLIAGAMVAAWLFLYFGIFLPRGPLH